jgi:hypothetical protein
MIKTMLVAFCCGWVGIEDGLGAISARLMAPPLRAFFKKQPMKVT